MSEIPDDAWLQAVETYQVNGSNAVQDVLQEMGYDPSLLEIRRKMQQLGILVAPEARGHWTPEEDGLLREHGPFYSGRYLQQTFFPTRSVASVRVRASALSVPINSQQNIERGGRSEPALRLPPHDPDIEVRVVALGDQQIPEISWPAHRAIVQFLDYYLAQHSGPTYLLNLGDLVNFTTLGRFDYEPQTPDVNAELETAHRVLQDYELAAGAHCIHTFIAGNHEHRLLKAIARSPELGLAVKPIHELLKLKELGVQHYVPYTQGVVELFDTLLVTHGVYASRHAGYSAKRHVEQTGWSTLTGHTHRLAVYRTTKYDKELVGIENGCLCEVQSYVPLVADWQLGFTYFRFFGSQMVMQQVPIHGGKFFAEGRWFGQDLAVH